MLLEESLENIRRFILKRYGDNLVGLIVFGSVNTGHFREERSDIDTMIFLKELNSLDLEKERKFLLESLKSENFHTQYFFTIDNIRKYVNERISWSTRITILAEDGSRILYSTPEFEGLRKWLLDNFPSKEDIKKYIEEKDNVELYGYFKDIKDFWITKGLMAHIRRKLQVLNHFQTNKLVFDYEKCLENLEFSNDEKENLEELYELYEKRKNLTKKQINDYYNLAEKLTHKIKKTMATTP